MNSYHYYQAVDFARDESFQQGVFQPDSQAAAFWNRWRIEHPEQEAEIEEARQLVLTFGPVEMSTKEERVARMKRGVFERILLTSPPQQRRLPLWRGWAAVGLVLLLVGSSFWGYQRWAYVRYATGYGETQTLKLPDGSEVTLNSNSLIQFASDWERAEVREVWLEGEAFFEVRQILLSEDSNVRMPFIVHSQNMDVEVLGTAFNVKDRQEYSEVVLNSGKVNVTPQLEKQTAPIAMNPGDRLAYSISQREWKIQQVDPEIPTAWRNQELIFDEMPLIEIARLLEDVYGYEISFATIEIESYAFTGNIRSDEIEMLLPMLERSFGLRVQQEGQQVTFSKNN